MNTKVGDYLLRTLLILTGVFLCAFITAFAALFTMIHTLPKNDLAYGQGVFLSLTDPFVFIVWVTTTAATATVASPLAIWLLWRVNLCKASPLIVLATVIGASLGAYLLAPLCVFTGLATGIIAMLWSKIYKPWHLPNVIAEA